MKLKIAIISDWYSENMGYAENFLPKAMAALGHDVHLIASTAQVYYRSPTYQKTYQPFLGPNIVSAGVKKVHGYTLHRLPMRSINFGMPGIGMKGMAECLSALKPNIVQTFDINSWSTYEAAKYCKNNGCKLFLESHTHASVFENRKRWRGISGIKALATSVSEFLFRGKLKFIAGVAEKCYPIASDVAKIVLTHFHLSADKVEIQSLGVDTDLFYPADNSLGSDERDKLRVQYGLDKDSMVCVYTGRFARDKKPQCLARAINHLQDEGENVQALFVGSGTEDEMEEIRAMKGCFIHEFVPVNELRKFYWIADIGIWPSQESTSQLDAAACGLPIILSNRIEVVERVEGNGLLYVEDNEIDLAKKIMQLKDRQLREAMAEAGIRKVKEKFSWDSIARARIKDYGRSFGLEE